MIEKKSLHSLVLVMASVLGLMACSSSRTLHYYSLTAGQTTHAGQPLQSRDESLGIGPVKLPESHVGDGVLVLEDDYQILVSDQHLWAGDLKLAVSRTLAERIAQLHEKDNVIAYPWDARLKPDLQLFIDIEQFAGPLNGEIRLSVRWNLYDFDQRQVVQTERRKFSAAARQRTYADYVADMNRLLDQFGVSLAEDLAID